MRHVGDMDAHLPVAVGKLADRKGVVEVLRVTGVNCEGRHITEILAFGNLFRRYARRDFRCLLLHILGIFVGQSELSEDSVHLGGVVAFRPEYVDDFAARIHLIILPAGDAHYRLVAVLAALQTILGKHDVGSEELGVGDEAGIILVDLEGTDKGLLLCLDDFDDASLRLDALTGCGDNHAHLVAVEGMH